MKLHLGQARHAFATLSALLVLVSGEQNTNPCNTPPAINAGSWSAWFGGSGGAYCDRDGVHLLAATACAGFAYITSWSIGKGYSNTGKPLWVVASIQASCSDGTDLQGAVDADNLPAGYPGLNGSSSTASSQSGYASMYGMQGSFLDRILDIGGPGGGSWQLNCTDGKKVVGYQVALYASIVQSIRFSVLNLTPPYCPTGLWCPPYIMVTCAGLVIAVIGWYATYKGNAMLEPIKFKFAQMLEDYKSRSSAPQAGLSAPLLSGSQSIYYTMSEGAGSSRSTEHSNAYEQSLRGQSDNGRAEGIPDGNHTHTNQVSLAPSALGLRERGVEIAELSTPSRFDIEGQI